MDIIEQVKTFETKYQHEDFESMETFQITEGELPVILSAPHSVTHFRNGKEKIGECMTGALVTILQKRLNCYCISKTKNDLTDPNFDDVHPYKEAIKQLVREKHISYLLDLHIMSSKRDPAIEIGTGKGKNIFHDFQFVTILKETFEKFQIRPVIVDELFSGGFKNTVSSEISRSTNIPCVQIEINWRLLDLASSNHQVVDVLNALEESILKIIEKRASEKSF